jgi:hypothetical protein
MKLWHCLLVWFVLLGIGLFGMHNYKTAYETTKAELAQAKLEITVQKTKLSAQEWYIADEQRKNAAHAEYIKMFEDEKNNNN